MVYPRMIKTWNSFGDVWLGSLEDFTLHKTLTMIKWSCKMCQMHWSLCICTWCHNIYFTSGPTTSRYFSKHIVWGIHYLCKLWGSQTWVPQHVWKGRFGVMKINKEWLENFEVFILVSISCHVGLYLRWKCSSFPNE